MPNKKFYPSLKRAFFLVIFTPLILVCLWLAVILSGYSIFPTNTYSAYQGWYEPGNAIKVKNHYSLDMNFIYFPWKYYLAIHPADKLACETLAPRFTPARQGIKLPDQSCFPIATSRLYTMVDPRRWLEKFFPFFIGYDLGYLLLAIFIWFATLITLCRMKFKLVPIILGSAVSLQTFWLSKELQYDQYSAPIPFLYLALACLVGADKKHLKNLNYYLFGLFAFIALLLTSLQGILLCGIAFLIILFAYFTARGWTLFKDKHFWIRFSITGIFVYSLISLLLIPSFAAFLSASDNYVKLTSYREEIVLIFKRSILPFLTLITIPTSNLFGNFDTIDPWKVLGWFGGREYVSVDTLTLYCGSLYTLLLMFMLCLRWRKSKFIQGLIVSPALRFWIVSFGGAWLLCTLPTYKFVYFRLIQFVIGFGAPIFVALALEEISKCSSQRLLTALKKVAVIQVSLWVIIVIFGQLAKMSAVKNAILAKLGTGGVLGFEPGFWQFRYQIWVDRLSLWDVYSLTLLIIQFLFLFLLYIYITHYHKKPLKQSAKIWAAILLIVQIVMLVDSVWHTWNWNSPQQIQTEWIINNPYWRQKGVKGLTEVNPYQAPVPEPNFLILYDQQPPYFYESLTVESSKSKN